MKIQHGLISADSHGQLGKDAYLKRMSRAKWGDSIPHIAEVTDKTSGKTIERWMVYGQPCARIRCLQLPGRDALVGTQILPAALG